MRIARKIMLLAVMASAVMALAASSASATRAIEVETLNSAACEPGPCVIHVDGESHLARLDTGGIVTQCLDEFTVSLNHNGSGSITWVGGPHGAPGCNTTNCSVMSPTWPITSREEIASGTVEFNSSICLYSPIAFTEVECNIDIIATRVSPGVYHFDAGTACPSGVRVELEAQTEPNEGVLIHHL